MWALGLMQYSPPAFVSFRLLVDVRLAIVRDANVSSGCALIVPGHRRGHCYLQNYIALQRARITDGRPVLSVSFCPDGSQYMYTTPHLPHVGDILILSLRRALVVSVTAVELGWCRVTEFAHWCQAAAGGALVCGKSGLAVFTCRGSIVLGHT